MDLNKTITNVPQAYEIVDQMAKSWSKEAIANCLLDPTNRQVDVQVMYGKVCILFSLSHESTLGAESLMKDVSSKLYTVVPKPLHDKAIEAKNLEIKTLKEKLDTATKLIAGLAFSSRGMEYKNLIKEIIGD